MKKLLFLILALALIFPVSIFAAGACTQTKGAIRNDKNQIQAKTITWVCTGDSGDGSIPNTDTTAANTLWIKGWHLYSVEAYPTSGGTAPDAASVLIGTTSGLDLLGAENGISQTAYAGLNLIHAASPRKTLPNLYTPRAGTHYNFSPMVADTLTLKVTDQATASANYTVVWNFEK